MAAMTDESFSTSTSTMASLTRAVTRPWRFWRAIADSMDAPVAPTPRDLIWTLHRVRLYRYHSPIPASERHSVPLVLVFAIINRPFIFDLRPGRSFIEYMLERGFDVWLVDWGEPGPEDADITFDDYATMYLPRAMRRVLRETGADEVHMLGYCVGALIALEYAALHPDGGVRDLVLLTPPIDQSVESLFTLWLDPRWTDVDKAVSAVGNLSVGALTLGSKALKPVANWVGAYVRLWDKIDSNDETVANWQALHRWVHDGVPVAAEAFRQYTRDYMWGNALITGDHQVNGRPVDMRRIEVPILTILAAFDHIVPAAQSTVIADVVGSDAVEIEVLQAGHVGIMAGSQSRPVLWPKLADWLVAHGPQPKRRKKTKKEPSK